ncbi:MAG: hypothetical protein L0Z53_02815, partial [Acidobacteriales bacterium]|nr:hypothetical protein [Terriglobales bacterium]
DCFGAAPIPLKMNFLECEVSGYQQFEAGGQLEQSGIVADADDQFTWLKNAGPAANSFNEFSFG